MYEKRKIFFIIHYIDLVEPSLKKNYNNNKYSWYSLKN